MTPSDVLSDVSPGSGIKISAICAVVVLLLLITLVFGYFGYPVGANNDGWGHIVPGIRLAAAHKLDNPILFSGDHAAVTGPYLAFMPLFAIFLHFFIFPGARMPMPLQAFIVIAVVNAAVIALSAWILHTIATMKGRRLDWTATAIICAALFMVLRASWSFGGRPETLVRLFFTVGFLLVLRSPWSWRLAAALGALLGLTAATHPFAPVFFFAMVGFALSLKYDFRTCLKYLGLVAGIGLITFAAAMQLSPYGIGATINGMRRHAALTAGAVPLGKIIRGMLKSSYVVLYGAIGIFALFFGTRLFLRSLKSGRIASPLMLIFSALIAAAYIASAIIISRSYYVAPFLLLVFAALLYYVAHIQSSKLVARAAVFLFVLLAAVSLKPLILFPFFLKDGATLPAARTRLEEVLSKNPGSYIKIDGSQAWTLSDSYDKMIGDDTPPPAKNYLFVREEEERPQLPQKLNSCELRNNFYTSRIPKIFGIPLGSVTPGYGFAVYECRA